jgi:short subunit dehydrogenase-like uncharacterized protein
MLNDSKTWMIYGANGYTGRLIADRAVANGHKPVLAGRDASKVEAVAKELDCPCRVFSLSSAAAIAAHLDGLSAVLHCAGPFSRTAQPMIEACLLAGVNYLDITGEWGVIEFAAQQHDRAVAAGISIMPAVGFDVVPSDCLVAQLAAALPTASELELAITFRSSISPGTAISIFIGLVDAGRVRKDGRIIRVPIAWKTRQIRFPSGTRQAMTIPWGDVSSAFHTTRIPNIQVYAAAPARQISALRRWRWLLPLTKYARVQKLGQQWIKRHITGPDDRERARGFAEFWGSVTDNEGRTAEATLITPEGYSLTAQTALEIVNRTLAGEVGPGFSTPAKAFGGKFIEQFEGVRIEWRVVPS